MSHNLLEDFALIHTQVSRLHADLREPVAVEQPVKAKVEIKLTPRQTAESQGDQPQYQITAQLICNGRKEEAAEGESLFTVDLVLQAIYRQIRGAPVDFETFTRNHMSLTRQLYPLMHQQLQPLLKQFGLDRLRLPHDLAERPAAEQADQQLH